MVMVIGEWLVLVVGGASVMAVARGQWQTLKWRENEARYLTEEGMIWKDT